MAFTRLAPLANRSRSDLLENGHRQPRKCHAKTPGYDLTYAGYFALVCPSLCSLWTKMSSTSLRITRAAIIAGGQSSRMGRDKALLPFDNQPLIAHIARIIAPIFVETIVVTANPHIARAAALPAIFDRFTGRGPLAGIHAALAHFEAPTFVVACDMPRINADFIRYICADFGSDVTARVPLSDDGFEPLHAIYAPVCLPTFERYLQTEGKMPAMRRVLEEVGASWIAPEIARRFDGELRMFENWNAPGDLSRSTEIGAVGEPTR